MIYKNPISIIIPTRNRAAWLAQALRSVAAQTTPHWDLWVIDDQSQDDTQAVLGAFRKSHPRLAMQFLNAPGGGVSRARNLGIEASAAPFVALLDSDDGWLPMKLEKQLALLQAHPEAALCHTDEIWMRNGKRVNPCRHHEKSGGEIFHRCLSRCVISPSASLIRRSALEVVGLFDEALPVCEDYDLWLRLTSRYSVAYIPEKLTVKHGGHADQLSRAFPVMDEYRIKALEKLLADPDLPEEKRLAVHHELAKKCKIVMQGARKRGKEAFASLYSEKYEAYREC